MNSIGLVYGNVEFCRNGFGMEFRFSSVLKILVLSVLWRCFCGFLVYGILFIVWLITVGFYESYQMALYCDHLLGK